MELYARKTVKISKGNKKYTRINVGRRDEQDEIRTDTVDVKSTITLDPPKIRDRRVSATDSQYCNVSEDRCLVYGTREFYLGVRRPGKSRIIFLLLYAPNAFEIGVAAPVTTIL